MKGYIDIFKYVCLCILQSVNVSGIFVALTSKLSGHYYNFIYVLALIVIKDFFFFALTLSVCLPQLPLILCLKELMRDVFFKGINGG